MILYVHIPFCASKCGYCAFNSSDSLLHLEDAYVDALLLDLGSQIEGKSLKSIFFGGGTPNILHQRHYEKIFDLISKKARLSEEYEITLECNPNLVTLSWCQALRDLGANRVSLGVQSFFDFKLDFLQRDHSEYDVFVAIERIRQGGIDNVSIDLIYNTPFDCIEHLQAEIECVKRLEIAHLSAYALSIDKGSKFYQNPPKLPDQDYSFEMRSMLEENGFIQYEVSNYFKTHKSHHNLAYWRGEDYIGCGAGGVGCLNGVRQWGSHNIQSYIQSPMHKHQEFLTEEERRFERIFLGLRCEYGVSLQDISPQKAQMLIEEKKCFIQEGRLRALDVFLADEIALFLG
ncbi:radical SAM family heme chaperone HemW [Helicobacter pametensis]|uniref:radical SAM family heme chaperone HemW n=1 Tax=Helicobacter pametensis TaxID=95149 RepID=UPI0004855B54|nr:radical SAM family heme chaperone HemW [Helicobacter pametensis]